MNNRDFKLFIFTFLILGFLIIGKAKAKTVDYSSITYDEQLNFFYNSIPISSYGDPNKSHILDTLIGEEKYKDYGEYYFCHIHNGAYSSDCFITDYPENIYFKNDGNFVVKYDSDKPVYKYHLYKGSLYNPGYITSDIVGNRGVSPSGVNKYYYERTNISEIKYISDDGTDLIFSDGYVVKNNTVFNYYNINKDRLSLFSTKPTITITSKKNNETINGKEKTTSVDVNVKFSIIDNDKYIYQYKQNELNGWVTYQFNNKDNFTLTYKENADLYVRVLDKETFKEVASATYTVSSLVPYLVLEHDDNSECYIDNKQVCDNIRVYPHLINYDKYYFYYSKDGGENWQVSYSAFTETVTESNKTYLFKITDLEGNIIDNLSYTQSKFGEFDTSHPYVKFEHKIDENLLVYFLDVYLYNYDTSKYKFYYSENGKDFYELSTSKQVATYENVYLKTYNPFVQMFSLKFTKNSYVYIKITDLEGNGIGTYTHYVDYDKAVDDLDDSWFKPIKKFVEDNIYNKLPVIEQLKDIYNSFQYVEGKDEPPVFNFDLSFINLGKITIKMDFFDEYRNTFFTYMKIFFSITTVYAVLNELKHVIGGGD